MKNFKFDDLVRPKVLDDIFGQEHITGENGLIRRAIDRNNIPSMIFYGPPGVGKTTTAKVIANSISGSIHMFNATHTKIEEIREVIRLYERKEDSYNISFDLGKSENKNPILYIDELQNFNKKQQQVLLDYIERNVITFIGATTENPNQYIYKALLSRLVVLEFKGVEFKYIKENLKHIVKKIQTKEGIDLEITDKALDIISNYGNGDVRKSVNLIELILNLYIDDNNKILINEEILKSINIEKTMNFDVNGDSYYDVLSAFHKSVRGSDENAALHYLARFIKAGDIKPVCRRLLAIASEDIGLAYPNATSIVKSLVDSALFLGLPEAKLPLAVATIFLATSPKSNSAYLAISKALEDLETMDTGDIPNFLKDAHYSGAKDLGRGINYKYPHDYENNYVRQQYLPDEIKNRKYYVPQNNKYESLSEAYKRKIQNNKNV